MKSPLLFQTPVSWREAEVGKAALHKRSASWGSMDHRREIAKLKQQLQRTKLSARNGKEKERSSPVQGDHTVLPAVKVSPPMASAVLFSQLNNSLDGLSRELEEAFVKEQGDEELLRILDVPDGHRAPAPLPTGPGDSLLPQLEHSSSSCSSLSLSPSPSTALGRSPHTPARTATEELLSGTLETPMLGTKAKENGNSSPVLAFALSPRPNHTYMFKREPPEGCEKIRAYEEVAPLSPEQTFLPSCPDKNKVHFNPTGSAFCRFSLVKPLIPSVDFLFTDFSSSPSPVPPATCSRQPTSNIPLLTLRKDPRGDDFGEASQSLPLESWKRNQAEDGILFHSSLVV
uniref:Uncharacterized protein n=1 Tax=Sphaerodactylus townsendi TaxID=933632 RepID=A0ACB8EU74_9SAUR